MISPLVTNSSQIGTTITTSRRPEEVPTDMPAVIDLVIAGFQSRQEYGLKKYGVPLLPFDRTDPLREALQEAMDQVVYLQQALYERDLNSPKFAPLWFLVLRMLESKDRLDPVWEEARTWVESEIPPSILQGLGYVYVQTRNSGESDPSSPPGTSNIL